jgi:hypothetical protein
MAKPFRRTGCGRSWLAPHRRDRSAIVSGVVYAGDAIGVSRDRQLIP